MYSLLMLMKLNNIILSKICCTYLRSFNKKSFLNYSTPVLTRIIPNSER